MSNSKKIGILGMAKQNQANGSGFDVILGQLCVLTEGYDKDFWKPVAINEKGEVFEIKPANEPLTFERIRKECVVGETLLHDENNFKWLYCGWDKDSNLIAEPLEINNAIKNIISLTEDFVKRWKISGKMERKS